MVDSPSEILQTCKILGPNSPRGRVGGQKGLENLENLEKLSPARGGYWGGRPLWDNSAYLHQHRWDIAQTFMVDSPSDNIQTKQGFGSKLTKGQGRWAKKVLKIPKKS